MELTEQTIRNYFANQTETLPGAVLRVRPENEDTLWSEHGILRGPWEAGTVVEYRFMKDGGIKTSIEPRSFSAYYLWLMYS